MQIQAGQKTIKFEGYQQLDPPCDAAFVAPLFQGFFADPNADFAHLINNLLPPFEAEMRAFFGRYSPSGPLQDKFFTNLTIIWRRYFDQGRFSEAKAFWNRIVTATREWEALTGLRVHKGSALYFWAVTALLQGEIDKGFLLMHSAVEEDVQTLNTPFPSTPAFMFAVLDFSDPRQFFYSFVKALADFLDPFALSYAALRQSKFTLDEFRHRFLAHPPSTFAVFSFTHAIARLHLLDRVPGYSIQSPFAGQYQLSVLSDLSLVVDAAIAHKDPAHWKFIDLATFLASSAGLGISKDDLAYANSAVERSSDSAIPQLLDGVFLFKDGNARARLESDLAMSYTIRNHAAHNLSSFPSISARFGHLRASFLNTLFLVVETLY